MEARYTSIYRLLGVSSLPNDKDIYLPLSNRSPVSALLTTHPDEYCLQLDRSNALASLILKGLIGKAVDGITPRERVYAEVAQLREARTREAGPGVFIIFTANDIVEHPNFEMRGDIDECSICFDGFNKQVLIDKLRSPINGILAAVAMALHSNDSHQVRHFGEVAFLIEGERPIYSFTFKGGNAGLTVARALDEGAPDLVARYADGFVRNNRLVTIAGLLVEALDTRTDSLRSFIAAWSALELFVTGVFKESYEAKWFQKMVEGTPPSATKYFIRLQEVMKDKYRLSDKFSVVSALLDEVNADDDNREFSRVKGIRDKVFHALAVQDPLPVETAQRLLRKYLMLHLDSLAGGGARELQA